MRPLAERFWEKVEKTETCWNWKAGTGNGYGRIHLGGKYGRTLNAQRISWMLHFGEVPQELVVCHRCDNTLCVRPDHLFLGTDADNMRDRDEKKRNMFGQRVPWSKLTPHAVLEIRKRSSENWHGLAKEFHVSHAAIWKVLTNRSWRSVS